MTSNRLSCQLLGAWMVFVAMQGCAQTRKVVNVATGTTARQQQEASLHMARVHEREGNLVRAEETLRQVLKANSDNYNAKHRLGVVLVRRGQTDEGQLLLFEAVAAAPKNLDMLNDLGYAYLMQGDHKNAEMLFRDALNISPKHPKSLNNLALTVGYQGRTDEAYALFRQTMSEAEAMANLGFVHTQRGEVDQAMAKYSNALSRDPSLQSAADALIQVYTVKEQVARNQQLRQNRGDVQFATETPESKEAFHEPIQLVNGIGMEIRD